MRRAVLSAGEIFRKVCSGPWWCAFVTLTYDLEHRWAARHVSEYLEACRRSTGIRALRYVWVAELQQRGAVHYHLAIWLPVGVMLPKPDRSGQWPHGMSRIEKARAPIGYLLKYCSKGGDADRLPRGCRLYGAGGLGREGRAVVRWWLLPRYVRQQCQVGDHVVRCKGGGWVSMSTGEWWPAQWPAGAPP